MNKLADDMSKDDGEGCGPKWGWARKGGSRSGPASGPWSSFWGGGSGPPWMRGASFGPGMGGAGRPGRMFAQGDLRLLLLALIADKPSHGYDLIRTIEAKFGGQYAPSPGTIYPTLTLLEEQDLVAGMSELSGKKSYSATPKGRQFLTDNADQVKALMTRIDVMAGAASGGPAPETIMHAVHTLRHAIMAKSGSWSAGEAARIRNILEQAARDILSGGGK